MSKTSVEGNRVTIDGAVYVVKPAGTDRHAVYNDFSEALGYFTIKNKTIRTDDYNVVGAHPLMQIGRLWRAAQEGIVQKPVPSKMVCELVTLGPMQDEDLDKARAHRRWLKTRPGLKAVFYAHDPATGKAVSIRVWATKAQMEASKAEAPPADAAEPTVTATEVLTLVEDL